MTAIQIKYLEYLEGKRKNLMNEKLTASQIQVERDKLAETIANNLRNYRVNVTKNEIQALANDQLNKRELAKLSETIRHDLVEENTRLRSVIEDERKNRTAEGQKNTELKIKQYEADIKNNSMLIDAMTSGKSNTMFGKLFDWFKGTISAEFISGGQILDKTVDLGRSRASQTASTLNNGFNLLTSEPIKALVEVNPNIRTAVETVGSLTKNASRRKEKEENEIPSDYSNSAGPGYRTDVNIPNPSEIQKPKPMYDAPIGPQLPTNRITSNRTPSVIEPSSKSISTYTPATKSSSAIIYAPGTKVGPGW